MGGHPYWYVDKYESNLTAVLERIRQREFRAGRYNPVTPFPVFPITGKSPKPGAKHATIEEAREDAEEDGTRSILDIDRIAESPEFLAACPLSEDVLLELYGTTTPSRVAVEGNMDFLEGIGRGEAVYIILYEGEKPTEVMFAGYSVD